MLFKTCPLCGGNLDPAEVCDCTRERKQANAVSGEEKTQKNSDSPKPEHLKITISPAPDESHTPEQV